jgi:hypothetical protein
MQEKSTTAFGRRGSLPIHFVSQRSPRQTRSRSTAARSKCKLTPQVGKNTNSHGTNASTDAQHGRSAEVALCKVAAQEHPKGADRICCRKLLRDREPLHHPDGGGQLIKCASLERADVDETTLLPYNMVHGDHNKKTEHQNVSLKGSRIELPGCNNNSKTIAIHLEGSRETESDPNSSQNCPPKLCLSRGPTRLL